MSFSLICSSIISVCCAESNFIVSSANEKITDALLLLGEDVLFMTSNGKFFANGIKHDYSTVGSNSYLLNNEVMVDTDVLEYAFNVSIQSDGTNALVK